MSWSEYIQRIEPFASAARAHSLGSRSRWHSKARPVVLLNASVNVTRGNELGLQTRKARSFVCIHSSSFRVHPAIAGKARAGKPVFGDGTDRKSVVEGKR